MTCQLCLTLLRAQIKQLQIKAQRTQTRQWLMIVLPKFHFKLTHSKKETKKRRQSCGPQKTPELLLKHLQTGGLIKRGQKVAGVADKGAGVGSERPEVRANEKDGWWMVLIQEAATPLYLGSTSPTCLGDGLAVSRLFMDHRASPISYMPPKDYNSKTVTSSPLIVCPSLSFGLIYFPAKKNMYFFCLCRLVPEQQQEGRKRAFHFHRLTVFENVFIMMILTFRYITQKRTSAEREREEKEGGKQAEGKIEPNPTISSQSCTLLINGWLVYQSLTDDCCF